MSDYLRALLFFFSSRRRHTRCSRDWSSDVCSSDLALARRDGAPVPPGSIGIAEPVALRAALADETLPVRERGHRSEERRVGKEWRSRWAPHYLKKKLESSMLSDRLRHQRLRTELVS